MAWLATRWWLMTAGALAGMASQVHWLIRHGWSQPAGRLLLGALAGALLMWGVMELAARLLARWPGWDLLAACRRVGRLLAAALISPLLPLAGRSRRFWAAVGLILAALAAAWYFGHHLPAARGALKVRALFVSQKGPGRGLAAFFYRGLAATTAPRYLGLASAWDFPGQGSFPGGRREFFRLRWLGLINIHRPGRYGFGGLVDDGLAVYVDGRPVVEDLGEGPPRRLWGWLRLDPGLHSLEIRYLQLAGRAVLRLRWQPPGREPEALPPGLLRPLKADARVGRTLPLRLRCGLVACPGPLYPPFQGGRFWRLPW